VDPIPETLTTRPQRLSRKRREMQTKFESKILKGKENFGEL
jgi:hypothetical protein